MKKDYMKAWAEKFDKEIAELTKKRYLIHKQMIGDLFAITYATSCLASYIIWLFIFGNTINMLWFTIFYLLGFGMFFSLGYYYEKQRQISKKLIENL